MPIPEHEIVDDDSNLGPAIYLVVSDMSDEVDFITLKDQVEELALKFVSGKGKVSAGLTDRGTVKRLICSREIPEERPA